jgi:hypothetical protein
VPADTVTPLCSAAQFTEGAFADLVKGYSPTALNDLLIESTRMCEDETGRRLAPFTGLTETHRANDIDPDEYSDAANLPMDIQSVLGASYAQSIGANSLVRHCWLDECAVRYPDMWAYSNVSVTIIRSYGGSQQLAGTQILNGPEPDTGHMWFQLGLFLPVGSRIQVTYGGGYQTMPASLVRAGKFMTAYLAVRELNPADATHDPDQLHTDALMRLAGWMRS